MQKIDIELIPGGASPPPIRVGEAIIEEAAIAGEMQYNPADSAGSAQLKAARALVVRELLRQRAAALGLAEGAGSEIDESDAVIAELSGLVEITTDDVDIPTTIVQRVP